jgi:hypothetical protein
MCYYGGENNSKEGPFIFPENIEGNGKDQKTFILRLWG